MSCKDIEHPDYYILKELKNQIKSMSKNMPFIKKIIGIEHDASDVIYYNKKILPFSYLNFINVKNNILMPININTKIKTISKLKSIFDKSSIKFINSKPLLCELGGLHCCSLNWKL
jgi:agmatine/peptidylarginine deiminase